MALLLKNILTSIPMAQVKPKTEYFAYEKMYCSPDPSTNSESTNPVFFLTNYTPKQIFFAKIRVKIRNYSFGIMVVGSGYHDKNQK